MGKKRHKSGRRGKPGAAKPGRDKNIRPVEGRAAQQGGHSAASAARMDTAGRWQWGSAIPYILTVWFVSRAVLTGIGLAARKWLPSNAVGNIQHHFGISSGYDWLDIWGAWDSRWYYYIAEAGYLAVPEDPHGYSAWAFFPLYPWLARAAAMAVGDTYIAGLIVSNAALLIGAWLLYKLVEQSHDGGMARKAVLFLFLFPTAYVFSCLMTEALFLALSVGAWYFARKGNWLWAGALGMASTMTRMVGLIMAPLLALEYLRQRKWHLARVRPDALWIGLVPAGLVAFMATCYALTGNPLQFADAQGAWTSSRVNPLRALWHGLEAAVQGGFSLHSEHLGLGYGAIFTIAVAGVLLWGRKRADNLLLFWSVLMVLISLAAHIVSTLSMPRYLAVLFPVFIILASLRTKSAAFAIAVAVLALLQAATFALWTAGWRMAV